MTEKRISERILFSKEDNITAQAYLPNKSEQAFLVYILSLSEDGVGLLIKVEKTKRLKQGDRIILKFIMTPRPLDTIDYAEVEIRHILRDKLLEFATLNCHFSRISDFHLKKIRQYVHYLLNEIGSQIYKKSFTFDYK